MAQAMEVKFSMFNLLHKRKNAPDNPLGEYEKKDVSWSGITLPDSSLEALNWPLRDVNAVLERGMVRGVSVFVEGIKSTDLLKSI